MESNKFNPEELYVKLLEMSKEAKENGKLVFYNALIKEMGQVAEKYMLNDDFLVAAQYL